MSLADLLKAEEPLFTHAMQKLEQASGDVGEDTKLAAEIAEKFAAKVHELSLDPGDSTGKEIYHALENRVKQDDANLAKKLGSDDPEDFKKLTPLIVDAVEKSDIPKSVWVIKKSVAKKFFEKMPPKNIMEHLGYKTVKSMLKREELFEIFGAIRFAESGEWLEEFIKLYRKLKPSDFTTRDIEVVKMSEDKWKGVAEDFIVKKKHNITHLKELGIILVLPPTIDRMPGTSLKIMPLLFHYFNEVRLYSAFFKLEQVKSNFGDIFVDTLIADPAQKSVIAGQDIHWRVIQRYFGKLKESHPEIFQPHVQPEDLHWRKAEESLYKFDKRLEFWKDLDYVGKVFDGNPVTMNLMDVSLSYSNGMDYTNRYYYHFREALWNEVFMRYMGRKTLRDQVLKQLDNDLIEPEDIN